MDSVTVRSPDKIIEDTGGCGRFQVRLGVTAHLTKILSCFSVMSMILISATPTWWCVRDANASNMTVCESANDTSQCHWMECHVNSTKCSGFQFKEGARTLVSEFQLVCGLDYVPSTVMSMQTFGMLLGAFLAGQSSDLFGRKPPFFSSFIILILSNAIGFLSVNWIMFAVARVFIGIGAGIFLAIQYCLVGEFTLTSWRAWVTSFPSWPIHSCLFALVGWLIQDWRYMQLFTCLLGLPLLLTWFIIPESFRWYIGHDRLKDAQKVISRVAMFNKYPVPEIGTVGLSTTLQKTDQKYTFIHLFKSKHLAKITLLLSINWLALGLVYYGISFAIQALAGNVYLNLFLFSLVAIPTKLISLRLQSRIGRRSTSMICFAGVAVCGFVVGIVQCVDAPHRDTLTNLFAILASMSINTAWGPVQTTTLEIYPTVIRNTGFGSLSVIARLGAVIGPQFVYLNTFVPGLLYFVCGGIALLCMLSQVFLPETRDTNLSDKLYQTRVEVSPLQADSENINLD